MKKSLAVILLVLTGAVMAYAGFSATQSGARSTACHTYPPIGLKAKASVKHGRVVTVTVSLGQPLRHGFGLTLQYRKPGSSRWLVSGSPSLMADSPAYLKWKAPKRLGRYRLRVKAEYSDDTGSGATYSSSRVITVY